MSRRSRPDAALSRSVNCMSIKTRNSARWPRSAPGHTGDGRNRSDNATPPPSPLAVAHQFLRRQRFFLTLGISLLLSGCSSGKATKKETDRLNVGDLAAEYLRETQQALMHPRDATCALANPRSSPPPPASLIPPERASVFLEMGPEDIHQAMWMRDGTWIVMLRSEKRAARITLKVSTVENRCSTFELESRPYQ
jgi:hypothetical protein